MTRGEPYAWEYLARGSGMDVTLHDNVAAWSGGGSLPHVLHDVATVDASTTVLGTHVAAPILVAPTAMHRFFTDDGELATARAARDAGTVFVVSMAATTSVEDVAAAVPDGLLWAQMYMLRDRGRTRALAERARASGYRAIVASVDGAAVGRGGATASAGSLAAPEWMRYPNLASPDDADIVRHHGAGVGLRPVDHLRRPGAVRRMERAAAGGQGRAARRRRRARGRCRRRGDRGFEPRRAHLRRSCRDRRRAPRGGRRGRGSGGGLRRRRRAQGSDVAPSPRARRPRGDDRATGALGPGARRGEGAAAVLARLRAQFEAAMAFCGAPTVDALTRDLVKRAP